MPRVPTSGGPSVAEQGLPGVRQQSVASPELFGAAARQGQALGDTATAVGVQMQAARNDLLNQANALRVDDALNQATEMSLRLQHDKNDGYTSQKGYAALSRESGVPLADEYVGKLKEGVGKISETLSNDQQRAMFGAKVNNVVTTFHGQAMAYEANQQRDYSLSVRDATVSGAKNALALNFTDPKNVELQATRIRSAIEGGVDENGAFIPGSAQMQGKSAAWAREKSAEAVSDAHGNAIKSAMETGNVNLAMAYFKRYGSDMTAKDVLEVQGKLQKDYDTRQGMTTGNEVFEQVRPQLQPTDMNRLTALVMGQESGGKRFGTDGKLLTSPKGAQGEMQVMPGTAKDPGYGVTPAKDSSPDELARVGRDYLDAMVKKYPTDVRKALAAYNAGPGAVDKAVADAKGGDWLAALPKETRDYVQNVGTQFASGGGTPAKPTLSDVHDQIRARFGPNASPLAVKTAIDQATVRYTDEEKATKQRGEEAVKRVTQALVANGGKYTELPPSLQADINKYAPEKVTELQNFGVRYAKGDDRTNDAVYLKLSDPGTLRSMSEGQLYALRPELSQSDFQHFSNERNKLLNPNAANGPGDLNSQAVKNTLDQRLRELKIDPTPKDDGGADAARVGAIRRYVDEQVMAAQRAAGKKLSDVETAAAIDRVFAQSAQLKGWVSTYSAPAIATKPSDIPSDVRKGIVAAFKKQGVDEPTDAQVLHGFLNWNANQKKK